MPRRRRTPSRLRLRLPAPGARYPPRPCRGRSRGAGPAGAGSASNSRPGSPAFAPRTSATCAARAIARRSDGSSQRRCSSRWPCHSCRSFPMAAPRLPSAGVLRSSSRRVLRARPRAQIGGQAATEAIFLDLPEAISVLALALGAGQSLRLALELAARDCPGPLGEELTRAFRSPVGTARLASARHLVRVVRQAGEPTLARFAELRQEKPVPRLPPPAGGTARAEQNRYLERRRPRLPRHARASRPIACRPRASARLRLPSLSRPNRLAK